jgi:hypothetical protein
MCLQTLRLSFLDHRVSVVVDAGDLGTHESLGNKDMKQLPWGAVKVVTLHSVAEVAGARCWVPTCQSSRGIYGHCHRGIEKLKL